MPLNADHRIVEIFHVNWGLTLLYLFLLIPFGCVLLRRFLGLRSWTRHVLASGKNKQHEGVDPSTGNDELLAGEPLLHGQCITIRTSRIELIVYILLLSFPVFFVSYLIIDNMGYNVLPLLASPPLNFLAAGACFMIYIVFPYAILGLLKTRNNYISFAPGVIRFRDGHRTVTVPVSNVILDRGASSRMNPVDLLFRYLELPWILDIEVPAHMQPAKVGTKMAGKMEEGTLSVNPGMGPGKGQYSGLEVKGRVISLDLRAMGLNRKAEEMVEPLQNFFGTKFQFREGGSGKVRRPKTYL